MNTLIIAGYFLVVLLTVVGFYSVVFGVRKMKDRMFTEYQVLCHHEYISNRWWKKSGSKRLVVVGQDLSSGKIEAFDITHPIYLPSRQQIFTYRFGRISFAGRYRLHEPSIN